MISKQRWAKVVERKTLGLTQGTHVIPQASLFERFISYASMKNVLRMELSKLSCDIRLQKPPQLLGDFSSLDDGYTSCIIL